LLRGHRKIGPGTQRAAKTFDRQIELTQVSQHQAQVVVRLGEIRSELQSPPKGSGCLGGSIDFSQGERQIIVSLGKVRPQLGSAAKRSLGFIKSSLSESADAEIVVSVSKVGHPLQCPPIAGG
jgi:hypothetical protein